MSLSFGSSKSKTSQNSQGSGKSDPWAPAVPYLKEVLQETAQVGGIGLTPDQKAAFEQLKQNAFQGNPWDVKQAEFTNQLYNTQNHSGMVGDAYKTLQGQLGDYASGKYLDPMSNPAMREMLTMVGDDAMNRVNAQFAAAGRDLSGMNQMGVGRGVTQAQLPLLMQEYARNQQMQMDAANSLYGAGSNAASTMGNLDAQWADTVGKAAGEGQKALDMQNMGPSQILELDQQIKSLPYQDLAQVASIFGDIGGLGKQVEEKSKGTSTTKGSNSGFGANIGGFVGGLLSDERAKEGVEEIGEMADGQKIYRWKYKDDPQGTVHVGPMAQEVEKRHPEAVSDSGPGGLKMVNMDAATRKAADVVRQRRGK